MSNPNAKHIIDKIHNLIQRAVKSTHEEEARTSAMIACKMLADNPELKIVPGITPEPQASSNGVIPTRWPGVRQVQSPSGGICLGCGGWYHPLENVYHQPGNGSTHINFGCTQYWERGVAISLNISVNGNPADILQDISNQARAARRGY